MTAWGPLVIWVALVYTMAAVLLSAALSKAGGAPGQRPVIAVMAVVWPLSIAAILVMSILGALLPRFYSKKEGRR